MIDALKRASAAHHRGHPLLRLRAPGPQGQAAHADHRQARGRPDHAAGAERVLTDGPARGADPGLLQHPGRPPLRDAGPARLPPRAGSNHDAGASSSRPTRAASSARAPTRSASTPTSPSSTSAAPRANEVAVMNIIGDVRDRDAVIVDDMIDTAGTLVAAATRAQGERRARVLACCTHAVLSGPAVERIEELAARRADRHRHDPAASPRRARAPRSRCCRSRISSARPSSASTTAIRSARSSSERGRGGEPMEEITRRRETDGTTAARAPRGACVGAAKCPAFSTARRATPCRSPSIAKDFVARRDLEGSHLIRFTSRECRARRARSRWCGRSSTTRSTAPSCTSTSTRSTSRGVS